MTHSLSYLRVPILLLTVIIVSNCSVTELPSGPELNSEMALGGSQGETQMVAPQQAAPSLNWALDFVGPRGLFSVWGASPSDVFAVGGTSGTESILHQGGTGWSIQIDGVFPLRELGHVWGFASDDVFAVGGQFPGTVLHYDGANWSPQYTGATLDGFVGVWGSSPSDVFAVGTNSGSGHGKILHYDGTLWSLQFETTNAGETFYAVWGFAPDDVFVVGKGGRILHYDGVSWTIQASGVTADLRAVWGSSPNDVFAAGVGGNVLHYNGASWTSQASPTSDQVLGLWGFASDDIFMVGDSGVSGEIHHYDGVNWSTLPIISTEPLTGIWGSSRTDLYVVSQFGSIFHGVGASVVLEIDIKPGSDPNSINCSNAEEVITVAILTNNEFDALSVDHTTVSFEGAAETHVNKKDYEAKRHEEDADGDGDTDLVLHFRLGDTGLSQTCSASQGNLTGETFGGGAITGTDTIRLIQ